MIIDEVAEYLEGELTGYTIGTNLFKAFQPDEPDNCITILDTGGATPDRYLPTAEPTFQILVRNIQYPDAGTICKAIVSALHNKYNLELVSGETYFYAINLMGEPGYIDKDNKNRYEFSMNFISHIRR